MHRDREGGVSMTGPPPPSLELAELKTKANIYIYIYTGYLKGGMASFQTWRIEILHINEKLLINKTNWF